MKRFYFALCVILSVCLIGIPVCAQEHGEAYGELSSDAYREAYLLLEEGIAGMAPVVTFPEELNIRYLDLLDIARSVCLDHPEYFWFLESWFYEYGSEDTKYLITSVTPTYYLDHQRVSSGSQALADAMIAFDQKVDEIITGIPVNCTSDYDIALYLHDYLAENVTYTLEGDHDSAYAALIHGRAACYGYSKAYQYLLTCAGVRSRIIVGDSLDENGKAYGHAWNQVWIDGVCYYADVTWDDLEIATTHKYFLMSLEEISKDHIADDLFLLPDCDHSLDYYQLREGKGVACISQTTLGRAIAEHFRLSSVSDAVGAVFVCDARFECDINSWLDRNAADLVSALKLSYSTELSYYCFGDVCYLILTDPAYHPANQKATLLSLNLTDATLKGKGAQVQLDARVLPFAAGIQPPSFVSDNEAVAVVSSDGMVTAVGPGTATVTVTSQDGNVSAQCVITVEPGDPHVHTLRYIPESAPTCELDGNDPYYLCTGCFHRFADENAENELSNVADYARAPTGHQDLIWGVKQNSHYRMCSCGVFIPQTTGTHIDADQDGLCDVCDGQMPQQAASRQDPGGQETKNWIWIVLGGAGVLAIAVTVVVVVRRRY